MASKKREEAHLEELESRLMEALKLRRDGQTEKATEELRYILKVEPRLAEPRMELASIALQSGQWEEAEAQAEEAVQILKNGGQWTEELDEKVLLSLAWNLLGEALRQQADSDEVVFGSPERWQELMEKAKEAFTQAENIDPQNAHASAWSFGLQEWSEEEAGD